MAEHTHAALRAEIVDPEALDEAAGLLERFAARTGLDGPPEQAQRYLWTDACAVEAWLGLHAATGESAHLAQAVRMAAQVHRVLGRHRPDDARRGWISGFDEPTGAERPTAGGLRIGKPLPERPLSVPFDERLEWDRDGQYFHYLVRWMLALDALAQATGERAYLDQAAELAARAVGGFAHGPAASERLFWKMSIDLSRPLVPSMGQHDALDGLVALESLRASQRRIGGVGWDLAPTAARLRAMCGEDAVWTTADPLGLGGLLADLARLVRLTADGDVPFDYILPRLVVDLSRGLSAFEAATELLRPASGRLAFRELGLAAGIRRAVSVRALVDPAGLRFDGRAMANALAERMESISRRTRVARRIEQLWRNPVAQATPVWIEHRDINEVMLAGTLVLRGVAA